MKHFDNLSRETANDLSHELWKAAKTLEQMTAVQKAEWAFRRAELEAIEAIMNLERARVALKFEKDSERLNDPSVSKFEATRVVAA